MHPGIGEVQDQIGLHQPEQGGLPYLSRAQQEHTAGRGPEAGHEESLEHLWTIPGIFHTYKNHHSTIGHPIAARQVNDATTWQLSRYLTGDHVLEHIDVP
jgi:hypothetical protein